jgi:hypothetical protein
MNDNQTKIFNFDHSKNAMSFSPNEIVLITIIEYLGDIVYFHHLFRSVKLYFV